jgi:hypothetical protein
MGGQLKHHRRYILYRFFYALIVTMWFVASAYAQTRDRPPLFMLALAPFGLIALFMTFNLMAFPFNYSLLGAQTRSAPPAEPPRAADPGVWGRVGLLAATTPLVTWRLYQGGVAVSMRFVGTGFVPLEHISNVRPWFVLSSRIDHNGDEVRSPLILPRRSVYKELVRLRDGTA